MNRHARDYVGDTLRRTGVSSEPAAPQMAARHSWPKPDMRLVDDDRAPSPALDEDSLPAGWHSWVIAEAEACACPRDYIAAGLIGPRQPGSEMRVA
jgi:hypothetical protein